MSKSIVPQDADTVFGGSTDIAALATTEAYRTAASKTNPSTTMSEIAALAESDGLRPAVVLLAAGNLMDVADSLTPDSPMGEVFEKCDERGVSWSAAAAAVLAKADADQRV